MRRILDWLNTSLLKGIYRDGDRMTFWATFAIRPSPRRAPEATLPISLTVSPQTAKLSLSETAAQPTRDLTAAIPHSVAPACRAKAAAHETVRRHRRCDGSDGGFCQSPDQIFPKARASTVLFQPAESLFTAVNSARKDYGSSEPPRIRHWRLSSQARSDRRLVCGSGRTAARSRPARQPL